MTQQQVHQARVCLSRRPRKWGLQLTLAAQEQVERDICT